jgi:hypothetical protein
MGILILAHNDGRFVDPQNKNLIELRHLFKTILLQRDIKVGLVRLTDDIYHWLSFKKLNRAKVKKEDQFRLLQARTDPLKIQVYVSSVVPLLLAIKTETFRYFVEARHEK